MDLLLILRQRFDNLDVKSLKERTTPMMKKIALIAFCAVLVTSCQVANKLIRVPIGGPGDVRPEIMDLIDLGSLSIPDQGELNTAESDGAFIAGEWVAVAGTGLNTNGTRLYLDGTETPVRGGIQGGGLIFRLPRDVKFRHTYTVRVETPRGSAESRLQVSNLLVMADARENRLVFWKTSTEKKPLFNEQELAVPCSEAGSYALAQSGGILYATARHTRAPGHSSNELKAVHLGAKGGPKEVFSVGYEAKDAVSLVATASHLFLLTSNELVVFSLAEPAQPKFLARQGLPLPSKHATYRDLILLGDGTRAVILEQENNHLYLINLADPAKPEVTGPFAVIPAASSSYSIGLAPDRGNANSFWLLTGVNTQQLRERFQALWHDNAPDKTPTRTALYHIDLNENQLSAQGQPFLLPEGVMPLGLTTERSGDILITAIAYEKETLEKTSFSLKGARNLVKGAWNSIFAGRVYRVTPQGAVTNDLKSVNLFVSLSKIDGSPLVYSSYHLVAKYLLPSVKVVQYVDVLKTQSFKVREVEMDWKMALPPYKFFPEVALI